MVHGNRGTDTIDGGLDTVSDIFYVGYGSQTSGVVAIKLNGVAEVSVTGTTQIGLKITELG